MFNFSFLEAEPSAAPHRSITAGTGADEGWIIVVHWKMNNKYSGEKKAESTSCLLHMYKL